MQKGIFVVFEGVDGSGKSTQLDLLNKYFQSSGIETYTTREPGGTRVGEKIREILLDPDFSEMRERTEALLYAAARAQLVAQIIRPKLELGTIVLCDRYIDSSLAYQGYGRGMELDFLVNINRLGTGDLKPDLTILLDLAPEEGLARSRKSRPADRLESEALDFHRKVRAGYIELSKKSNNYLILNARDPVDVLHGEITAAVGGLLSV
ncbi:dTMP kinase [Desulforamulus aquiferis]|uniref:Thymidylate kinase n=1 Tax=Desulforamulus aquiferis TaxID=1397668 RepID=A0AAW7ZG03_9FIRM|nr:dTMP kinase [Desulforamulus aquiferis]MDO7788114.1 dTMP kinase [Desulforamulus aquiferis]